MLILHSLCQGDFCDFTCTWQKECFLSLNTVFLAPQPMSVRMEWSGNNFFGQSSDRLTAFGKDVVLKPDRTRKSRNERLKIYTAYKRQLNKSYTKLPRRLTMLQSCVKALEILRLKCS